MKTLILAAAIVASALSAAIASAQDVNGPEGGPGGMMRAPGGQGRPEGGPEGGPNEPRSE